MKTKQNIEQNNLHALEETILRTFNKLQHANILSHSEHKSDYLQKAEFSTIHNKISVKFVETINSHKNSTKYEILFYDDSKHEIFHILCNLKSSFSSFENPVLIISNQIISNFLKINQIIELVQLKDLLLKIQKHSELFLEVNSTQPKVTSDMFADDAIHKLISIQKTNTN